MGEEKKETTPNLAEFEEEKKNKVKCVSVSRCFLKRLISEGRSLEDMVEQFVIKGEGIAQYPLRIKPDTRPSANPNSLWVEVDFIPIL